MSSHYYILRRRAGEPGVLSLVQKALDSLQVRGKTFDYGYRRDLTKDIRSFYWLERNKKAVVKLVIDTSIPVNYLIIEAMTPKEVDQIGEWLDEHLQLIPLKELQKEAHQHMESDPSFLVVLALGAGETFDPVTFEIIMDGLHSLNQKVRYQAVMAASLTRWSEFNNVLEEMYRNESDPEIRDLLDRALRSMPGSRSDGDVQDNK